MARWNSFYVTPTVKSCLLAKFYRLVVPFFFVAKLPFIAFF